MPDNRTWPGIVALVAIVAAVTTLTALGVMTSSQAMPILGGIVVIVERLIPRPSTTRRSRPPIEAITSPSSPSSHAKDPPPPGPGQAVMVVAGMGAGLLLPYLM